MKTTPLRFPVIINLDLLSDIHYQAAITLAELPLEADIEEYEHDIEIDGINTEKQLNALKTNLSEKLEFYSLTEHQDNFIYLYHLFKNYDAPDSLYEEMLYKKALENVNKLIDLVKLKSTDIKNLIITIKSKRDSTSVTFDTEFVIGRVWEDLYQSLLHYSTIGSGNHILRQYIEGKELTVENLKQIAKRLRIRHNRFWNQSLAQFAKSLHLYLRVNNIANGSTHISSEQARIVFDIMNGLYLLNPDEIGSQPDDYIKALFKNNKIN